MVVGGEIFPIDQHQSRDIESTIPHADKKCAYDEKHFPCSNNLYKTSRSFPPSAEEMD